MLVLKRHWEFWLAILGLHKLGAIAIPATNQLQAHDFEYRFQSGGGSAPYCAPADGDTAHQVDLAAASCPELKVKIAVGGSREGWHDYDGESVLFTRKYDRPEDAPCGDDTMLMFFTSGTTGYPKIAGPFVQISPGALHHRPLVARGGPGRAALHHFRHRMGQGPVGQAVRAMAVRGRSIHLRLRPVRRGGHSAPVRQVSHHHLLRAADHVSDDDQAGPEPSTTSPPSSGPPPPARP